MALEKKHKILIGSFSSLVIIFMISSGVMMYLLFVKQNINYDSLDTKITNLQSDTSSKINDISESLMQTNNLISSEVDVLNKQLNTLKASAGDDFSGIIEVAVTGVVTIRTDIAQGTGFLITDDGYVVTNYHVVDGARAATIITSDNANHQVSLIGYNLLMDIALLKITGTYDSLELGDSDDVQIGEKVIAIGNPLGLQFSVSQGIVSAIHRTGSNGFDYYIQTDTALNPGNSGGPLIDKNGRVIGINNFKIGTGENLGFALESNYIKITVNEIAEQDLNQTLIN